MNPVIPWYKSQIIWLQIVSAIYAVLRVVENVWELQIIPRDLTEGEVVDGVVLVINLATVWFRQGPIAKIDGQTYKALKASPESYIPPRP